MTRGPRVPKITEARFPSPTRLAPPSDEVWPTIENRIGRTIDEQFRMAAIAFLDDYQIDRAFEEAWPHVADVVADLDRIADLARDLRRAIEHKGNKFASTTMLMFDERAWANPAGFRSYREVRAGLVRFLGTLREVREIVELERAEQKARRQRSPFERLVHRLADQCDRQGIRVSARTDSDKANEKVSPFVCLVWTLMLGLPEELRVSTQSIEAFSKAVQKALRHRPTGKIATVGRSIYFPPQENKS